MGAPGGIIPGGGKKKLPAGFGGAKLKKSFLRMSPGGGGIGSAPGSPGMLGTAPSEDVTVEEDCLA